MHTQPAALTPDFVFLFWGLVMTILLGLLFGPCFISDRVEQFQIKLLLLQGYSIHNSDTDTDFRYRNLYTDTEYLIKLDWVERDFCSARQDYAHTQQEVVTEGRDLGPSSQKYLEYKVSRGELSREAPGLKPPPWPSNIVTTHMSYFMTGGPGNEHRTNKPQLEEIGKGRKETPCVWAPLRRLAFILAEQRVHHQGEL